jgi:hypothetical protein
MFKKIKFWLLSFAIWAALIAGAAVFLAHYPDRARRDWKNAALPEINQLANDPKWISTELKLLATTNSHNEHVIVEGWLTDHLILMTDGEWLVYKSHCSKESPHLVRDIFLAKASNGKWYYSTCHFCVGMCVLIMEQDTPPVDLSSFVRRYRLEEFDGVSDKCLQPTQFMPDLNDSANQGGTWAQQP